MVLHQPESLAPGGVDLQRVEISYTLAETLSHHCSQCDKRSSTLFCTHVQVQSSGINRAINAQQAVNTTTVLDLSIVTVSVLSFVL